MTRKSSKHCVRHTEPLDSCFDFIRSHQLCIPWSSPLEIESTTTECRVETLPLNYWSTSLTSYAKLTSHSKRAVYLPDIQWGRSQYTLLMRPNQVETAIQWFRMSHAVFAGFSGYVILFILFTPLEFFSWWSFTGVWVTASVLKYPGFFSVFWPFSTMP